MPEWDIAQQGRGLIKAAFGRFVHHTALGDHGNARHLCIAQKVPHALLLALADKGAHMKVHRGGANAQVFKSVAQAFQQVFVNRIVYQKARPCATRLPTVLHDGVDYGWNGRVQVSISKHNLRAFAAQFKRHRTVPFCR